MGLFWFSCFIQINSSITDVGLDEVVDLWPLIFRFIWFFVGFVVVVVLGWYLIEPMLSRIIKKRNRNNPTIQESLSRYIRLFFIIVGLIIGVSLAGYTRFLGSSAIVIAAATLVVGVAGQTVVGSILSGLVLVVDPEFNIGNYIKWSEGEGEIKSITLRVTRVHSISGELITVPNTTLTNEAIIRPYGRNKHRIVERIGLDYQDDIDKALNYMEEIADNLDDILDNPKPTAYIDNFGNDAIIINIHYWIGNPRPKNIMKIKSEYARQIKNEFQESDITISPPSKRDLQGKIQMENTTQKNED